MQLRVYRSLDRPSAFFGIRGRYQSLTLYALVIDLVLSFLCGRITNGLIGTLVFLALGAVIFLGVIYVQGMYSDRTLFRFFSARRLPGYIKLTPERFSTILKRHKIELK